MTCLEPVHLQHALGPSIRCPEKVGASSPFLKKVTCPACLQLVIERQAVRISRAQTALG